MLWEVQAVQAVRRPCIGRIAFDRDQRLCSCIVRHSAYSQNTALTGSWMDSSLVSARFQPPPGTGCTAVHPGFGAPQVRGVPLRPSHRNQESGPALRNELDRFIDNGNKPGVRPYRFGHLYEAVAIIVGLFAN